LDRLRAADNEAKLAIVTTVVSRDLLAQGVGLDRYVDAEEARFEQTQVSDFGFVPAQESISRSNGEIQDGLKDGLRQPNSKRFKTAVNGLNYLTIGPM